MEDQENQKAEARKLAIDRLRTAGTLLQQSVGYSRAVRDVIVEPAMQKKSLEALKACNLTADDIQAAVERNSEFIHPFLAMPFLGIDPTLWGQPIEGMAERQEREHREKEMAQVALLNQIHAAIDDLLSDAGRPANALLIHPSDYRLLLCREDAFMATVTKPREYRGLRVFESLDVEVGEVRVGYMK